MAPALPGIRANLFPCRTCTSGQTPLMCACTAGCPELVKLLLAQVRVGAGACK
jgi:hypothetical protein